jgi:hypothetical protein
VPPRALTGSAPAIGIEEAAGKMGPNEYDVTVTAATKFPVAKFRPHASN